jgi:diaminohydroxyphosphoribosylaminopyrimidine deaminase/5-amino-6-(5-phosphoribosylamino)uracil reductase
MYSSRDVNVLHQAARLAVNGHGGAEPNPLVGCIIVNQDDAIVGEGFHELYGDEHAEVNALAMAGTTAKDCTAYITLEPCNHHGKTPPCSEALLQAGISRVVIGAIDPNSESSGGIEYLRNNGIEVDVLRDDICEELIAPFAHRIQSGLPWVTCKWAQTNDGCIETPENESSWISSKESQQLVHEERGCVDAIVVGVGTVIVDNPSLTVRNATKHRTPLRIVIDPTLRTPSNANVLNLDAPTLIAHADGADISGFESVNLLALPHKDGILDLAPLFQRLVSTYDATHVTVEGGSTLFQHVINQKLANELWVFTSPKVSTITPKVNMNELVSQLQTRIISSSQCGVDTVTTSRINW